MLLKGLFGSFVVATWLSLFVIGLLFPSKLQRDAVLSGKDLTLPTVSYVAVVWTPTNVGLLALLAGLAGGVGRAVLITRDSEQEETERAKVLRRSRETVFAGVLKSFLIYLAMLAGVYLFTNQPFVDSTPEQYARVAGTVSLFAFMASLQPAFFQRIVATISTIGEKE